jgi:hypothetical protein
MEWSNHLEGKDWTRTSLQSIPKGLDLFGAVVGTFTGCVEGKGVEVGTSTGEGMVGNCKEDGIGIGW